MRGCTIFVCVYTKPQAEHLLACISQNNESPSINVPFFTLRTVFVPMRSFFVSRCSFQFMKLLFPPFFIFQNRCITRIFFFQDFWKKTFFSRISGKKTFFPGFLEKKLFFQDFWNQLFTQAGFILKTFSKGKKIIFCMEFLKIICLGEFCFLSNVVPKAQAFCPLKLLVLPQ